nr:hypothetical protein [Nostoc sp. 'Peltigera membranacea cyanobiont' 210A]
MGALLAATTGVVAATVVAMGLISLPFVGLRFASPNLQFFTKPSVLPYKLPDVIRSDNRSCVKNLSAFHNCS